MTIDDPLDQGEAVIASENRQANPGTTPLVRSAGFVKALGSAFASLAAGSLPLAGIAVAEAVRSLAELASDQNAEYMLNIVIGELRYLHKEFDGLSDDHQKFLNTDWLALLVDAERKARLTRSRARVRRIAEILCESARVEPPPEPDQVEELMRLAMLLDDLDVQVLREAVRVQGRLLAKGSAPSPDQARTAWRSGAWRAIGAGDVESAAGKLVGLSLLSRLDQPSNNNDLGAIVADYLLCRRAIDFVRYVENESSM